MLSRCELQLQQCNYFKFCMSIYLDAFKVSLNMRLAEDEALWKDTHRSVSYVLLNICQLDN